MTVNYCEGCFSLTFNEFLDECKFCAYNPEGQCPCTHCIIKVMCDVQCDNFAVFRLDALNSLNDVKEN